MKLAYFICSPTFQILDKYLLRGFLSPIPTPTETSSLLSRLERDGCACGFVPGHPHVCAIGTSYGGPRFLTHFLTLLASNAGARQRRLACDQAQSEWQEGPITPIFLRGIQFSVNGRLWRRLEEQVSGGSPRPAVLECHMS